jgi:ketosteroid isomerase-like protein
MMKMKRLFVLSLLVGFAILSSCSKTETSATTEEVAPKFDLTAARAEIDEANRNFMDLVSKGDSVGLANFYTEDAKFMMGDAPSAVGRANIQKAMSDIIKSGVTKVDLRTKDVFGTEELLAEEGELTIFVKDVAVSEDKYIVLWKNEFGKFKFLS